MPLTLQSKLLRVLQEQEIERVGGVKTIQINVRIICCTNQNLQQLIREKKFRNDLYYRINTVELKIPPLRDRKEDIPELTEHFIQKYNNEHDTHVVGANTDVLQLFQTYQWPSNVRELEHIVERLCTINQNQIITPKSCGFLIDQISNTQQFLGNKIADSEPLLAKSEPAHTATSVPASEMSWNDLAQKIQTTEREAIIQALLQTNGNKAKAARLLNIDRSSLYYKLKKYNITK